MLGGVGHTQLDGASVVVEHHFIHETNTGVRLGELRPQLARESRTRVCPSRSGSIRSPGVWLGCGGDSLRERARVRRKGGDRGVA
jgi:hypothetical protein